MTVRPRARTDPPLRLAAPVLAALLGLLTVLAPAPADAHPFGAPQTVDVSAADDGGDVRVRWRAGAPDDLTALAAALGLVPDERVMLDGAVVPSSDDGTTLAGSAAFADYLLDRITVRRSGSACTGDLEPVDHVGADGVAIDFECPTPGGSVEVTVRTLTDLHAAYRTLATGPAGQKAVYTDADDTHTWALGRGPAVAASAAAPTDLGRSAVRQLGLVGAIALASVACGLVWLRRRGRRA